MGSRDETVSDLLTAHLRPGDVAVDIGAHHGIFTKRFANAVGPTGRVLAFEPDPETRAQWVNHAEAWPYATVLPYAITDVIGTQVWYQGGSSTQHSLWAANVPKQHGTVLVETTTLDAVLDGITPRVIKIDAQGAEVHILRGARETLDAPDMRVMVEIWPAGLAAAGESVQAMVDILSAARYVVVAEGKDPQPKKRTWGEVMRTVAKFTGHAHTNVIVAKAA